MLKIYHCPSQPSLSCHATFPTSKESWKGRQEIQILANVTKNQAPVVYHNRTAMIFGDGCAIAEHIGLTIEAIFADEAENFINVRLSLLYSFLQLRILKCTVCVLRFGWKSILNLSLGSKRMFFERCRCLSKKFGREMFGLFQSWNLRSDKDLFTWDDNCLATRIILNILERSWQS